LLVVYLTAINRYIIVINDELYQLFDICSTKRSQTQPRWKKFASWQAVLFFCIYFSAEITVWLLA